MIYLTTLNTMRKAAKMMRQFSRKPWKFSKRKKRKLSRMLRDVLKDNKKYQNIKTSKHISVVVPNYRKHPSLTTVSRMLVSGLTLMMMIPLTFHHLPAQ